MIRLTSGIACQVKINSKFFFSKRQCKLSLAVSGIFGSKVDARVECELKTGLAMGLPCIHTAVRVWRLT